MLVILPLVAYLIWQTVLGRPSLYFDELFGEQEFTRYNFFFLGMNRLRRTPPTTEIQYIVVAMSGLLMKIKRML
jgi:hypothetical protein